MAQTTHHSQSCKPLASHKHPADRYVPLSPPIQSLGNAPGLYDKAVLEYSVKNQLRWRNNLG